MDKLLELESKLTELSGLLKTNEEVLATAQAEIATLKAENKELQESKARLEMELSVKEKNEKAEKAKNTATSIMAGVFAESKLDASLHSKVEKLVPYGDYVKDGELDATEFTNAFKAEVSDWEGKLVSGGAGLGLGSAKIEEGANDKFAEKKSEWDSLLGVKTKKEG